MEGYHTYVEQRNLLGWGQKRVSTPPDAPCEAIPQVLYFHTHQEPEKPAIPSKPY
jgi:hypothetical protein